MRLARAVPGARTLVSAAAGTAVLLLLASVAVFALVRLAPGDRVDVELAGLDAGAYLGSSGLDDLRDERRAELGLDRPLASQYADWLGRVVRLDLGRSYQTGRPVEAELAERLPASLALAGLAAVLAVPVVLALAVLAVRRPGGLVDHGIRGTTILLAAVPSFLIGSLALGWASRAGFPVAGPATAERIWLPAVVLALGTMPTMARVLRASLLAELAQPYAEAAHSRGVAATALVLRHTLRPASGPVLTLAGLSLASLLAGSVITEVVFTWPGIAAYAVQAIRAQDYPVIQAYVLLMVLITVLVNRGIDLAQRVVDPRVEAAREVIV